MGLPSRPRPSGRRERGVAILAVITVLVALILIAIPFVISQKLGRDRTEANAARSRAYFEADLVCRAVISYLHGTHPEYEQARRAGAPAGTVPVDADETVDSVSEFTPDPSYRKVIADLMTSEKGAAAPSVDDPRGSIWNWKVTDANALVNPNGASPYLLGNLLGAGTLSEDLDAAATIIPVEAVFPTPAMGLVAFRKEGGFVRIGNETIQYQSFDDGSFKGCQRGVLRAEAPLQDNGPAQDHKKGERVIDYVAYKLATHLISAKPGRLTAFANLEDLKSVQTWGGGGVLEADRFESLLPFLTVWSRRETAETFLDGQLVVNALPDSTSETVGEPIRVRDPKTFLGGDAAYFNAGTLVRITDGVSTDYTTILAAGDDKGGQIGAVVTAASRLPEGRKYEGLRTAVEPLAPYPIDVNAATREVLAAVFAGLRLRTVDDPKEAVTPEAAWDLAGLIVDSRQGPLQVSGDDQARKSGPFRAPKDLGTFLKDLQAKGTLTARQTEAVLRNAVNPHDDELAFGTANFCFRTLDVYHVEGRAVINDAAGRKQAEAALREVVEIGADRATVWSLDSQADFDLGLELGSGGKYVDTYPKNCAFVSNRDAHVQPRRRAPQWYQHDIYPSDDRSELLGDVRLQAARLHIDRATLEDHFDYTVDVQGWATDGAGAYLKPVTKTICKADPADPYVHAFTVSMWMQPFSNGNWFAFDTGKSAEQNRISIFVRDGDQGKELVLRVFDATLEQRAAEIYVPLTRLGYEPETWYHLQANVRGCDPAQMELLVDGVSVGRRAGLSFLTAGVASDATTISVESTRGFEAPGAVLIGDEVVEYDTLTSDAFSDCRRGARGTKPQEWPQGAGAKRVGYSHPLLLELRHGGASLESNQVWERWNWLQVAQVDNEERQAAGQLTFFGAKPDTTTVTVTLSDDNPTDTTSATSNDKMSLFNTAGYALLAVRMFDPGSGAGNSVPQIGGWEVVYYERAGSPNRLTLTRYQSTTLHQDAGTQFFLATSVQAPAGTRPWAARIAPISVVGEPVGDGAVDYLNPGGNAMDKEKLAKYPLDGGTLSDRPRLVVGIPDQKDPEAIVYDSLDVKKKAPKVFFVRDNEDDLKRLRAALLTVRALTNADFGLPATPPSTGQLPPAEAKPTADSLKSSFAFRGVNDTKDLKHPSLPAGDKDSLLLPGFRILRIDAALTKLPVGGPHAGRDDVVTLSTGTDAPRREQRKVRWSHGVTGGGNASNWVALTEFIEGATFPVDVDSDAPLPDFRGKTRLLKFPSGEMPDEHGENVAWGRDEVGGGSPEKAFLDEVFVWMYPATLALGLVDNQENVTEKEKEITLRAVPPWATLVGVDGYDKDCGLVDLDGELIVYRHSRSDTPETVTLEDCRRGVLGTKARSHARRTYARFVPHVFVSFVDGNVTRDAATIPLGRTRLWPLEGAARIVSDQAVEIVHYTGLSPTGMVMPEALDADTTYRGRGLFRGRYGTEAVAHDNGEIVVWQPIRFWDRALLRRGSDQATFAGVHDHPEGSYVELAKTVRNALWQQVRWTENLDGKESAGTSAGNAGDRGPTAKKDILVLVRFDQGVPWGSRKVVDLRNDKPMPPEARDHPEANLYLLDNKDGLNRFDVEASTFEARVYFRYLIGAYTSQEVTGDTNPDDMVFENAWKATPWLQSFTVRYENRTQIRYSAEIR